MKERRQISQSEAEMVGLTKRQPIPQSAAEMIQLIEGKEIDTLLMLTSEGRRKISRLIPDDSKDVIPDEIAVKKPHEIENWAIENGVDPIFFQLSLIARGITRDFPDSSGCYTKELRGYNIPVESPISSGDNMVKIYRTA